MGELVRILLCVGMLSEETQLNTSLLTPWYWNPSSVSRINLVSLQPFADVSGLRSVALAQGERESSSIGMLRWLQVKSWKEYLSRFALSNCRSWFLILDVLNHPLTGASGFCSRLCAKVNCSNRRMCMRVCVCVFLIILTITGQLV